MRIFKKGFTLAELLLVIGIIGIVSAMGASITKKTTQKAYDLYYYTGFVNLYDAYADTNLNTGLSEKNKIGGGNCDININNPICHINNLLGTTQYKGENDFTIVAKNGVRYKFHNYNSPYDRTITMFVPQPKTRNNPNGITGVLILPTNEDNTSTENVSKFLMPINADLISNQFKESNIKYIHIGNRIDLLPTYLDNGLVGRMRTDLKNNQNIVYNNIQYLTFDNVVCNLFQKKSPEFDGKELINCSSYNVTPFVNSLAAPIKFADPRKAK